MRLSNLVRKAGSTLTRSSTVEIHWIRRSGWIGENLRKRVPHATFKSRIEAAARRTNGGGPKKLAPEYKDPGASRLPDEVRTSSECGDLYAWLVRQRKPSVVVEFGSAFGISGMYFASGIESVEGSHLYSFEINQEWAEIAEANIRSITGRATVTRGAFEEKVDEVLPGKIGIAFVDGIHTYEFVTRQFALLRRLMLPGGLILLDDINFGRSGSRMREAWEEISTSECVQAAVEINGRVGLVEL